MASESMEEMTAPTNEMPKPMACVQIPKSQAQKLKVGQMVTYTTTGKIKGIHEGYAPKTPNKEEEFSVDIEVETVKGFENNTADMEMQKLRDAQ